LRRIGRDARTPVNQIAGLQDSRLSA